MAYDIFVNALNICRRQIRTFGIPAEFHHFDTTDYGETDYTDENETVFTLNGIFHSGTGKMGSATAIRFSYTSEAGVGIGQSDSGILVLYDGNNMPKTGDICYLQGTNFYVRIVTDILEAHKVLDISLEVVGIVSP